MTYLVQQWQDSHATDIAIDTSPPGGAVEAIAPNPTLPVPSEAITLIRSLRTPLRDIAESAGGDNALTTEVEPEGMPDWDIVDEASRDSFPASDPPPWWAGRPRT